MRSCLKCIGIALLYLSAFAGCATVTKDEIASAHFEPLPANYEQMVKDCVQKKFVRPDTAIYRFEKPRRGFDQAGLLAGGKKRFGWVVPVRIKAKNLLGFYLPERPHYIFIAGGRANDCTDVFGQMTNFVD